MLGLPALTIYSPILFLNMLTQLACTQSVANLFRTLMGALGETVLSNNKSKLFSHQRHSSYITSLNPGVSSVALLYVYAILKVRSNYCFTLLKCKLSTEHRDHYLHDDPCTTNNLLRLLIINEPFPQINITPCHQHFGAAQIKQPPPCFLSTRTQPYCRRSRLFAVAAVKEKTVR